MLSILDNLINNEIQCIIPSDLRTNQTTDANGLPTFNTNNLTPFDKGGWFQGNFNDKYIADLPFDKKCFQPTDRYMARIRRTIIPAPHYKTHTAAGQNNLLDELTMIFQEGSSPMITPLRSASWMRVVPAETSGDNTATWRRSSINNAHHVSPLMTDASPNYYVIDPGLTDHFYFPSYTPSYRYNVKTLTLRDNKPMVGVVTLHFGSCTSTTAPNIVVTGLTTVWSKAFTPVSGKPFRVVVDFGMISDSAMLTGISNP